MYIYVLTFLECRLYISLENMEFFLIMYTHILILQKDIVYIYNTF